MRRAYAVAVAAILPLALVALAWVFANGGPGKPAKVIDAGVKPIVPAGSWGDVVNFPIVTLGFWGEESPTGPLYLKRAVAAGYPPNGKVYILGGKHRPDGADIGVRWIWEYNPANNTLTQKNAMLDVDQNGSRYVGNMAVGVLTGTNGPRIYLVGGSTVNGMVTGAVRVYDPNTDTLTASDDWPASPPRVPGGYAVYNNKLYIFGGHQIEPTSQLFNDTWVFDPTLPSGQRWSHITSAKLSVPRAYIAGAELDGYIYAIGGDQVVSNTATPLSIVERMDPTQPSPTWQSVASLPWPKGDIGAWAYDTGSPYEIAGRIVVAGGGYPVPDTAAFIYNPGTNAWTSFPDMLRPRRNYAAAQLNGILYAWGGYDVQGNLYNGSNTSMAYNASGPPPPPGITPTPTPSPEPTSCTADANYNYTTTTGQSIDPGNTFVTGTNCQTCVVNLPLPFPVELYGRTFNTAVVGTTGNMQFGSDNTMWINRPLSDSGFSYALVPFWDELDLTSGGIYTSLVGTAPNRVFNVEWRGTDINMVPVNFEARLIEGQSTFEFVYGPGSGGSGTIGVQKDKNLLTQVGYNVPQPAPGTKYTWTTIACAKGTPTPPIGTSTATDTPTPPADTPTALPPTGTATPPAQTATGTPARPSPTGAAATPTACAIGFSDVPVSSTFYTYIHCLACLGIASGYPDGTFRPNNNVTRGQLSKIVSNSAGYNDPPGAQRFQDVPAGSTFYDYVQRLASRGYISGYQCGGPGEPCVPPANLSYFRPDANATRGQIAKIVSNAAGYNDTPIGQTFQDVAPTSAFYVYVYRLASRGIVGGYQCGGAGEPCVPPANLPYFRPNNNATRGQSSKIVAGALVQDCSLSDR
jgi:hypothetical protein